MNESEHNLLYRSTSTLCCWRILLAHPHLMLSLLGSVLISTPISTLPLSLLTSSTENFCHCSGYSWSMVKARRSEGCEVFSQLGCRHSNKCHMLQSFYVFLCWVIHMNPVLFTCKRPNTVPVPYDILTYRPGAILVYYSAGSHTGTLFMSCILSTCIMLCWYGVEYFYIFHVCTVCVCARAHFLPNINHTPLKEVCSHM
jgi:hypothetical protein